MIISTGGKESLFFYVFFQVVVTRGAPDSIWLDFDKQ